MYFLRRFKRSTAIGAAVVLAALPAMAQESAAILNALVRKGILTQAEAAEVAAEAARDQPVRAAPASSQATRLTVAGRIQAQYAGLDTSIDNASDPASVDHFFLRRVYLTARANFGENWSSNLTYNFAGDNFDSALVQWKDGNLTVDVGLRKVNLGYEERTSGGSLKAIERSGVNRYFIEENNGRRLGAGAHRVGVFVDNKAGNFFYGAAITNPERAVNFSTAAGAGGPGNNSPAYWANAGYNAAFDGGRLVLGGGVGILPDQGGKTVGAGDDLNVFTVYSDLTLGKFNLAGEYLQADVERGASATRDAKPSGFWIQPSYRFNSSLEGVFRYSYVDSDGRGVNLSDGVRSAPSGGTMDKLTEMYAGGTWYIKGNDLKLQAGVVYGQSEDTITGAPAEATAFGFRSQMQVQF